MEVTVSAFQRFWENKLRGNKFVVDKLTFK